jgi:hypothetical protein
VSRAHGEGSKLTLITRDDLSARDLTD